MAIGTHGVHFGHIMRVLSTVGYSLGAKMVLNVHSEYRQYLAPWARLVFTVPASPKIIAQKWVPNATVICSSPSIFQIFTHADTLLENNANICTVARMDTKTIILIAVAALLIAVWLPVLAMSLRRAFEEMKKHK